MPAIELRNVSKSYGDHLVLKDINLSIDDNEFILIDGESGSGKSTLLNLIGLLDKPDEGEIKIHGSVSPKPFSKRAQQLLRDDIGWLFQNFALIQDKTVEFNLKTVLKDTQSSRQKERMEKALKAVGLSGILNKKVCTLSGGEQQRTAIARLLLKPCSIVLADEPTGSLDEHNRDRMIRLIQLMKKHGKTVIVVSHDPIFRSVADRTVHLDDLNHKNKEQNLRQ